MKNNNPRQGGFYIRLCNFVTCRSALMVHVQNQAINVKFIWTLLVHLTHWVQKILMLPFYWSIRQCSIFVYISGFSRVRFATWYSRHLNAFPLYHFIFVDTNLVVVLSCLVSLECALWEGFSWRMPKQAYTVPCRASHPRL